MSSALLLHIRHKHRASLTENLDHLDPFRPSEPVEYAEPLDSNPFDQPTPSGNPFTHPNDSAFSLDSQDTERGLGEPHAQASGYEQSQSGYGQSQAGYGQGQSSTDRKKMEDLSKREADLRRRETELAARERDSGIQRNNWPPCTSSAIGGCSTVSVC